jgi:hypothetical protein
MPVNAQAAKLPAALWPEIDRAAVYLHNRTPRYQYNLKSPYDRFHTYLAHRDGVVVPDRKPQQAHLKVYGCKAFALTMEYLKKEKRLHRFNPKAWLGYLVGYDSTNVYRIWNPIKNTVIRSRDVIFNEDQVFDGNLEKLRDDCLDIDLDDLSALLTQLDVSQRHENDPNSDDLRKPSSSHECDECILAGNPGALDETVSDFDESQELTQLARQALDAIEPSEPNISVEFTKGQQP